MLTIEFLGAPYSGKSYYKNELEKDNYFSKYNVFNYRNNFFCNLPLVQNLNIIEKNILKIYCNKKRTEAKQSGKQVKKKNFLSRFFQNKTNSLIKYHSDLFKKKKPEFSKIIENYFEISEHKIDRFNNLNRWINELFASYEVYISLKSKKNIIIDSEGFIHRANSFIISNNDSTFIENYLKFCPKPDILIYIDENLDKIRDRIKESKNQYEITKYENIIENMHNNSSIIFEKMKNYSTEKFVVNSKNFLEVKDNITDYLNKNY